MRIGGIASGIDTEQIVKDLMNVEKLRLNKFIRQEQTIKWRQEAFSDINKIMANFVLNSRKDLGLNQVSTNGTIRQTSVNSFAWVKSASTDNVGILSATARFGAVNGEHTVEVNQLASNATLTSANLKNANVLDANNNFIEDGEITVASQKGNAVISFAAGDDISTFINKINNATTAEGTNLGLKAAFDLNLGQIMITSKDTGTNSKIEMMDSEGTNIFKMFNSSSVVANGTNASIKFNGNPLEMATNNFTVFGIDLNLKSKTPVGSTVKIQVDTNTDGIMEKIKGFVAQYNEMVDIIDGKLGEKRYRSYQPLVQEEKDAMSEKEIELWEEKAKSGLLYNEEGLSKTLQSLRENLYKNVVGVTGSYNHLSEIGITTGSYKEGGKLVINEDKLKDAIANDPEGVMDIFFKVPEASLNGESRIQESGIIQRMYDGVVSGMKEVIRKSGTGENTSLIKSIQGNILIEFVTTHSSMSLLDRDLSGINSRITREQVFLSKKEDRYWKQFSAMEKAMNKMQQQSAWLMSQMGGMGM